ncbi:MAG: peptide chain release factor 2 [candidate division KSB1 bacterium]|nr:peptide chain release factor 2 [candidate division KSB1 bacterium]MDZ7272605.1 peptide chain release factor 2 [candidate division KSB1 bacterium]MDZ7284372.1 peptide chain release factor 2 [candidate division KSB1 bacterium]MDZ7297232.1 peptide chain release factor 2 [candidate division KSB1 bacterium]MDZ7348099.1 peptide chain release factor 2 [candidate division KSB1 bacterium]
MREDLHTRLKEMSQRVVYLRDSLEIPKKEKEIEELEKKSSAPDFWNDNERAQAVMRELAARREWVSAWQEVERKRQDAAVMLELAEEARDESVFLEAEKELDAFEKAVAALEFRNMLSGEHDANNAILTLHPGAGGTESQDWTQMLYRMYLRWIERKGFKYEVIDLQAGEEAGLKDATIEVTGPYAYGYLKAEAGVHRLVRISPFDANKRRHTSFASVFVLPVVENNVDIKIEEKDLRIDTYRASGAGGQHVNKTSSAVRITHVPTGIVVQCQNERSQIRNRDMAMKLLMAKLYQLKLEQEKSKFSELEKNKKDIAWGSQIRSYVFHPYNLVKDHRTGVSTGNVQAVMDGDLDEFIKAYLMGMRANKKGGAELLEELEIED